MRCVLDLQGAQSQSRFRGIGRHCLSLARAMAVEPGPHELGVVCNGLLPEAIGELRRCFEGLVPDNHFQVFSPPGPVAAINPENEWRARTAEKLRECFLADLKPDVVHVGSLFEGFLDDAVTSVDTFTKAAPTAVTNHDLIPLLRPDDYLAEPQLRSWYLRKLRALKSADILLAVSEASRKEALDHLGLPADRVAVIPNAADELFKPVIIGAADRDALLLPRGIVQPFIMYSGGADPRKNLDGLLKALGLLPPELAARHQLVIVGQIGTPERDHLLRIAQAAKLPARMVAFTGYISDDELVKFYNLCRVFVLPSFHEGFGLPALEAMACGAPTIGSNTSSIPEVVGYGDALFDPASSDAMATKIELALTSHNFRSKLREHGLNRSRAFSWRRSAQDAWNALGELHSRTTPVSKKIFVSPTSARPTLAYVCPPASQGSYLDQYTKDLLSELAKLYKVTTISPRRSDEDYWAEAEIATHDPRYFVARYASFDRVVYQLGDTDDHAFMWYLLQYYPGTVVLHDFPMRRLLAAVDSSEASNHSAELLRSLYKSHGYPAVVKLSQSPNQLEVGDYPCNRAALDGAAGIIVHDRYLEQMARRWYGEEAAAAWVHIPLPNTGVNSDPGNFASQFRDAIEMFAVSHPVRRENRLLKEIARPEGDVQPTSDDLQAAAAAIASLRPLLPRPQLLLDVSETARFDAKTGIQRVARHLTFELVQQAPASYYPEPIQGWSGPHSYARDFVYPMIGTAAFAGNEPVDVREGDVYVALDLAPESVAQRSFFRLLQARNVPIHFVLYDLLPILRPNAFPTGMTPAYTKWLTGVLEFADGVACISRAVADELIAYLDEVNPPRLKVLSVNYFHLGADIPEMAATTGGAAKLPPLFDSLRLRPSILMVGTIEPRKGYVQALAALNRLWAEGLEINLVVVGKMGWMMEQFAEELNHHRELGKRLFVLNDVSDDMLTKLYAGSSALLAASEAEGFGLPLIEAARYKTPIIARNIPVFREVAGDHAFYFEGDTPESLASGLRHWLSLRERDSIPSSEGLRWLTWKESAAQLMEVVLGRGSYRTWMPAQRRDQGLVTAGAVQDLVTG